MRTLLLATAITGLGLIAGAAHAVPIAAGSTLNVVGNSTFTSTQVNFTTPGNLVTGTGDFTALGTCTGCVAIVTPFTYSPFTATTDLFSASNAGVSATVSVTAQNAAPINTGTALILSDAATLTLTGKDATPGTLTITVNQATGVASGSFSATGQATPPVPEPSTIAILGAGLLGLGVAAARRRR